MSKETNILTEEEYKKSKEKEYADVKNEFMDHAETMTSSMSPLSRFFKGFSETLFIIL